MSQTAEMVIAYSEQFAHLPTNCQFQQASENLLSHLEQHHIDISHIKRPHGIDWRAFFKEISQNPAWQACYITCFEHACTPICTPDKTLLGLLYRTPLGCFYQAIINTPYQTVGLHATLILGKPVLEESFALQSIFLTHLQVLHRKTKLCPERFGELMPDDDTPTDNLVTKFVANHDKFLSLWQSLLSPHGLGMQDLFVIYEPITPFYQKLRQKPHQDKPFFSSINRLVKCTHQHLNALTHLPFGVTHQTDGTFVVAKVKYHEKPLYGKSVDMVALMSLECGVLLPHKLACDLLSRAKKIEPASDFAIFSLKNTIWA